MDVTRGPGRADRGFTLVELLIVVAIIGILSAAAVVNFKGAIDRGRQTKTITTMRNMGTALSAYELDHNHLPASGTPAATLAAILGGHALSTVATRDAWNFDLVYVADQDTYTVRSFGRDGTLGPANISRATKDVYENDLVLSDGLFTSTPER